MARRAEDSRRPRDAREGVTAISELEVDDARLLMALAVRYEARDRGRGT